MREMVTLFTLASCLILGSKFLDKVPSKGDILKVTLITLLLVYCIRGRPKDLTSSLRVYIFHKMLIKLIGS